ncbi:epidermal retinol dehydrogenase 2-like, partial [Brachionus plicatilis]
ENRNNVDSNFKNYLINLKNLLFIYLYQFLISLKIVFSSFIHRLIALCHPEKSIKNQIVLITGSGGYLGRHLALEFAKRNAILVLWDVNEDANRQTVEQLKSQGFFKIYPFKVDLTDQKAIKSTAERIRLTLGHVSVVLMVAAASFKAKSILDTNFEQDIEMHFKISYLSQLWLIQEFLQPMINKNWGHFLTVSSNSALIDMPLISSYASFKLAQTKLIETLREELIFNGIDGVKTTIAYPSILKG